MTLSGGTTGTSFSMSDSKRCLSKTCDLRESDGSMIRECCERWKKWVLDGYWVMALRTAGMIAHDLGWSSRYGT